MKKAKEENQKNSNIQRSTQWHCDIYCRKIRFTECEGQEHVNPDAPDLCPYFDEMLYLPIYFQVIPYDILK